MESRMTRRLESVDQGCQKWKEKLPDMRNGLSFRKAMVFDLAHRAAYCWNAKVSKAVVLLFGNVSFGTCVVRS